MKKRLYFCDQKKDCRTSSSCGRECIMTFDREHRAAAVDFDDETCRHYPVSHSEELRGYITESEKEDGL